MGIGVSLFLGAVGAILYFAVDATVSGVDISTVGVILMIIGGLGLVLSVALIATQRARRPVLVQTPVVTEQVIRKDTTY